MGRYICVQVPWNKILSLVVYKYIMINKQMSLVMLCSYEIVRKLKGLDNILQKCLFPSNSPFYRILEHKNKITPLVKISQLKNIITQLWVK